jgi:hypothetical protein
MTDHDSQHHAVENEAPAAADTHAASSVFHETHEHHDIHDLSPYVNELLTVFETDRPVVREGYKYRVSRTVSMLAVLYEKARNAVEFRAEHLVRRAAIERILKRLMFLKNDSSGTAENLILELLWAKYIDSSVIDDNKVREIQKIINKYLYLKKNLYTITSNYQGISWDKVMGIASSEIDENLVSSRRREALNNFFYQSVRPKINVKDRDERYVNMLTYIAVERAYAQADEALISCHLLKLVQPEWFKITETEEIVQHQEQFFAHMNLIAEGLKDQLMLSISRYIRKHTPPFLLIRDFLFENSTKVRSIVENTAEFDRNLTALAAKRYNEIGTKVRRAVVRSIIYIFLTKMVFALALEAPFDLFITHKIAYLALIVNTIFPPILLFLVAGLFSIPGAENTKSLVDRIFKIMFHFDEILKEPDSFVYRPKERRPILAAVFTLIYIGTFGLVFGFINWGLTLMQFNIASKIIFLFFVTLVTFFAYRIRQSAKEYELIERQGFLEPFVDFIFLPVLRAGHWLSGEIARLNVFIVIFDFILEAPLKAIFEVFEEWVRFIRTKKEEIV